jgi:predicted PurR-regulated permease PerM
VSVLSPPVPGKSARSVATNLVALGVVVAALYFGREFFITLIIAVTISLLLEPFVDLFMKLRLPRAVASFLVCALALTVLYLVGVGLYTQVAVLWEDLPNYASRINEIGEEIVVRMENFERNTYQLFVPQRIRDREKGKAQPAQPAKPAGRGKARAAEAPLPTPEPYSPPVQEVRILQSRSPVMDYFYSNWRSLYRVLLMASFVPFLVYFMLSWRDHLRRSYLQLFHGPDRHAAGRSWQGIADMARAYVFGNFVLGIFLSIASGVFFYFFKVPYWLLVAPLSGFLSLVPYIGLPLAMIPPFFAALPVYNRLAPYLILGTVIAFLHMIALNLLYPKLVGSRVHMNPLAVTVALMFWGTLWGAIGLVLAIPVTAGLKAVFDNVQEWQPYGKLLGD